MATKPKAILSTHDGREASPITKASNVLFENGQTAQDILNDRQDAMISPVIENSSSMFKVGQGDDVDYSANVVNGAYESMVLKGKSMVNCIQEPSSQDVVLPYEFADGQYVTINDTKESGALGVELKGQTLVNIHDSTTYILSRQNSGWYNNYVTNVNEVSFTITNSSETGWKYLKLGQLNLEMLKPNTKYLVVFSETKNLTTVQFMNGDGTRKISNTGTITNNKAILTTNSTLDLDKQVLYVYFSMQLGEVVAKNAMIFEYQDGMENWDIPYFTGMASCKMPIIHTVGKNLFDHNNFIPCNKTDAYVGYENGYVVANINVESTHFFYKADLSKMPRGIYSIIDRHEGENSYLGIQLTRKDGTKTWGKKQFDNDGSYAELGLYMQSTTSAPSLKVKAKIMLIMGDNTTTPHEDHKSSILSLPEEVVLRSLPNGVCDTFNTRTGVYTQRIGEVVLNGSEGDWVSINAFNKTNVFRKPFSLAKNEVTDYETTVENFMTDKLPVVKYRTYDVTNAQTVSFSSLFNSTYKDTAIYINKNSSSNLSEFKTWLSQNPVTVQYELKTPIVTKINLSSTLKSWNTTTHVYSEIPENTLYPTLSHSNPSYPVILKPSTKYSIVANSYSNSHTNSTINFNLGGATASTVVGNRVTTVTTPSTLSNELLTMSGRGNKLNNVMVIEGDVMGDEPYFEGICDCKSPILSNVGKNLFNGESRVGYYTTATGIYNPTPSITQCCNITPIQVSGGTKYSFLLPEGDMKDGRTSLYDSKMNFISSIINADVRYVITTTQNTKYINFHFDNATPELFSKVQLEESSSATSYEPYKSNILSCNGDKIELTEDMFEQGTTAQYTANIGKTYQWMKENSAPSYDARRLRLKELIKIQPNTKLILQNTDNFMYAIAGYDANKLSLGTFDTSWIQNTTITIPQDVYYISFAIRKKDDTGITINDFKNTNFTLSEVDKTIVLRSLPNGVCDTLNVETGEYVKRIGEVVLDGSTNLCGTQMGVDNHIVFYIVKDDFKGKGRPSVSSDNFPTYSVTTFDKRGMFGESNGERHIWFILPYNLLKTNDLQGALDWLRENPTTVQYELETPIIKTVDLSGYPFSYENGHVQLSSGSIEQSLTPKVEYSVATNRNGQIRSNQKMVERHQKQLDQLQAIILANLVNSQYNQTLTTLKYELSRV